MSSLRGWTSLGLSKILGPQLAEEVTDYVLSLSAGEAYEYCESLLGTAPDAKAFTTELVKRLESPSGSAAAGNTGVPVTSAVASASTARDRPAATSAAGGAGPQHARPREGPPTAGSTSTAAATRTTAPSQAPQQQQASSAVRPRPVADIGPPAPSSCSCFAREHGLLANCLWCGRVMCVEHRYRRCTCGALLPSAVLAGPDGGRLKEPPSTSGTPGTASRASASGGPGIAVGAEPGMDPEALARKDRLLHYDRTSASRTKVLDDDSDYFAMAESAWLSPQEREAARRAGKEAQIKAEADKRGMRITLDFAGRAVTVRDERAEERQAAEARLLGIAQGKLHGAHGAVGTVKDEPAAGGRTGEQDESGLSGSTAADDAAAQVASRGAQLEKQRQESGAGSGRFANATLSGRAAEIYSAIVAGMVAKGKGKAQEGHKGQGSATASSSSSRLQHSELQEFTGQAQALRT